MMPGLPGMGMPMPSAAPVMPMAQRLPSMPMMANLQGPQQGGQSGGLLGNMMGNPAMAGLLGSLFKNPGTTVGQGVSTANPFVQAMMAGAGGIGG